MFTGIIECIGRVHQIENNASNLDIWISSDISNALKIDQSVAHNGVCLTVVELQEGRHRVVAIRETLEKTCLRDWQVDSPINLERSVRAKDRIDGHFVQGHVDQVLYCRDVQEKNGSWNLSFDYPKDVAGLLVARGSICINGISLTIARLEEDFFTVAIIPYTYHHTNIHLVRSGSPVHVEFDILAKYILRQARLAT